MLLLKTLVLESQILNGRGQLGEFGGVLCTYLDDRTVYVLFHDCANIASLAT
jgi:hypothetical protein